MESIFSASDEHCTCRRHARRITQACQLAMRRRGRKKQAQALARSSHGGQTGTFGPDRRHHEAYNFYDFFVAALKVIYHAVRRCGAFLVIQEARDRHAVTVRCVRPSPPALRPPDPIANARSLSLAGADGDGRAEC